MSSSLASVDHDTEKSRHGKLSESASVGAGSPSEPEMSIDIEAGRDASSGVTTLRMTGELTFTTAKDIESALDQYAGEGPTAVIVDLTALDVAAPAVLAVLSGVAERTVRQSGVPV